MKTTPTTLNRYLIKVWYSDEDGCYIAEVPALRGCMSHGKTYRQAAANIEEAMEAWLDVARKHGDQIPEPDIAAEEIARLRNVINVAKLARSAGVNQHTLASKLRRGTRLSPSESVAIRRALELV